jgi:hypothetical protein
MLSFGPFIQYGSGIENYMLFINLEKSPMIRLGSIEIYTADEPGNLRDRVEVISNSITVINLDRYNFGVSDLPTFSSKDMCGIPLFFSKTYRGDFLSLEHTHPPVSYVVHGQRIEAQKILKRNWFKRLGDS